MGGVGDVDSWYIPSLVGGSRTMVLMGRTGNGKSATGNSIWGRKAFKSESSMSSVTSIAECQSTKIPDGQVVNIIDTPGLFDSSVEPQFIIKEIVRCIDLAKDGIHAILLILSIKVRFTEEESSVIESLQKIFGPRITDYMIVVFTGGDSLKKNQSLEELLFHRCPSALKKVLDVCKNRVVLFDNNTEDKEKKATQLQKLLGLIDKVIEENDRKPYADLLFFEMKEELNASNERTEQEIKVVMRELQKSYDEQLKRMMEMVQHRSSIFELL